MHHGFGPRSTGAVCRQGEFIQLCATLPVCAWSLLPQHLLHLTGATVSIYLTLHPFVMLWHWLQSFSIQPIGSLIRHCISGQRSGLRQHGHWTHRRSNDHGAGK